MCSEGPDFIEELVDELRVRHLDGSRDAARASVHSTASRV